MKVFVNFPQTEDDKIEFENRVADFHATLLFESIKKLNINDVSKKNLLNLILEHLMEQEK